LGFEDLTRAWPLFRNRQRRAIITDAKIEAELVEACFDFPVFAVIGDNLERLHGAEYRTVDDIAACGPAGAILREELFDGTAVVAFGLELQNNLLAHPEPHDHIEQNRTNRSEHERVADDGLKCRWGQHECITIDVRHDGNGK